VLFVLFSTILPTKPFMKTRIAVEGASFLAFHGYFEEENAFGNHFVVDAEVTVDGCTSDDDDIEGTVDYARIYQICREEMEKTSRLLETVAGRIIRRLQTELGPVLSGKVKIAKQQPQLGGKVGHTIVEVFF
jgi:dihydroneopterin aldolase